MYPFDVKSVERSIIEALNVFGSLGKHPDGRERSFGECVNHLTFMLSEINKYHFSKIEDKKFYSDSKYLKDKSGEPVCNFAKICSQENWEAAKCVGDELNRAILTHTTLYQDYVIEIKNSSEYISIQRNLKLRLLVD